MPKVTPTKCKTKDIFAPRKSVQDAKEKIGPAYFDPTLLECSRNAVELTKLVQEWENIDKEKAKFVRDLRREQNAITKSFKRNLSAHSCDRTKQDESESSEGIETNDGKQIPPGFRFRSNGEMKSMTSLPMYNDEEVQAGCSRSLSRATSSTNDFNRDRALYDSVDYQKEIEELETVITNISNKISACKVSGSSGNGSKCYLRSHSHDVNNATFINPYNKNSIEKSRSRKLHQYMIKTPCSRNCSGCQYKLKSKIDDTPATKKQEKDVLNRRWNYVPTGKYVQSSTALKSATSVLRASTSRALHSRESNVAVGTSLHTGFGLNSSTSILRQCSSRNLQGRADDSNPNDSCERPVRNSSALKSTTSVLRPCSSVAANCAADDSDCNDCVPVVPRRKMSVQFKNDSDISVPDRTRSAIARTNPMKPAKSLHSVDRQVKSAGANPRSIALNTAKSVPGLNTENMYAVNHDESDRPDTMTSLRSKLSNDRLSSRLLVDYDSRMNMLKEYQSEEEKHCQEKVKNFLQQLDKGKQ